MSFIEEYAAAAHTMQTGVGFELAQEYPHLSDEALKVIKHLRVGINSAMVEHAALVHVLVSRGVMSLAEYETELVSQMQQEVERYEKRLAEVYNAPVTLL